MFYWCIYILIQTIICRKEIRPRVADCFVLKSTDINDLKSTNIRQLFALDITNELFIWIIHHFSVYTIVYYFNFIYAFTSVRNKLGLMRDALYPFHIHSIFHVN